METVFFTIAPKSLLPQARCLFESLATHEHGHRLLLCLVEEEADPEIVDDAVEVLLAKDMVGDGFYEMAYKYSARELAAALKPFVIRHLLNAGADRVVYLDPQCFLFAPLEEVRELFDRGVQIVVTPQTTRPITDGKEPNELDFLRTGAFNLGFLAVSASDETHDFVGWWSERLRDCSAVDPANGFFLDQKWVDLAPSFFESVTILRHPGYNVGYWNAFQRKLERRPGGWQADGQPLRFFNFTGLAVNELSKVSRYQNRLTLKKLGAFAAEFEAYLARLASNALKPSDAARYSYSNYWRGRPIDCPAVRAALRRSNIKVADFDSFKDERPVARLMEAHGNLPVLEMFPITRLMYDALLDRPAIARQYPLFTAEERARFLYWVLVEGHVVLGIDRDLLPWRELTTPVEGALGGRFAVPPLMWLLWLSDSDLRRTTSLESDEEYALLLLELQKQIGKGERPKWQLPREYTHQIIIGEGASGITVAQYAVWLIREDLQDAFDIDSPAGRAGLLSWFAGPSPASELAEVAEFIRPAAGESAAA